MEPLIAAAPELLEALLRTRNLAANLEARNPVSPETLHAVWEAGDRAIAKAQNDYILPTNSSCWIRAGEYQIFLTTWHENWAANIEVFTQDDEGDLIPFSRIDLP